MLNLFSFNIGSLFGKGRKGRDILTITAEAAKNATYRAKTDLKIDHLTDAVETLGDRIEKRIDGLHSCIDKAQREARQGRDAMKTELKEDIKNIRDRLDKRDDYLETKIDTCRAEKHN